MSHVVWPLVITGDPLAAADLFLSFPRLGHVLKPTATGSPTQQVLCEVSHVSRHRQAESNLPLPVKSQPADTLLFCFPILNLACGSSFLLPGFKNASKHSQQKQQGGAPLFPSPQIMHT